MTDTPKTDTTTIPTVAPFWVYTQQGWHQAAEDFWAPYPGGALDDWLASMGYRKCLSEHEADAIQMTIWRAEIPPIAPYHFLVDLAWDGGFSDFGDTIGVTDLPALLEFLRVYGAVGAWPQLRYDFDQVWQLLSRAFEAWHGHSPDTFCHQCDDMATAQQRDRKRLQALKRQGGGPSV